MENWVLDLVFRFLRPIDLLACSQVSKEFCVYARSDAVWKRHKDRIVKYNNDMDFEWKPRWKVFVQCLMPNVLKSNNSFVLKLWTNTLEQCAYNIICLNRNEFGVYDLRVQVNSYAPVYISLMFANDQYDKFCFTEDKLVNFTSDKYEQLLVPYYCVVFDYMEYFDINTSEVDDLFYEIIGQRRE